MSEQEQSKQLTQHLIRQCANIFGLSDEEKDILMSMGGHSYSKSCFCLHGFQNKYFNGKIDPFNSVMYCIYLYWYAKYLSENGYRQIADKVYYLNKMLNAVDLFYGIDLPEVWGCEHPVGSVIGKAKYKNGFYFFQNCTVGGNTLNNGSTVYPDIGENVCMYSYSRIIGNCSIGNNVVLASGSAIINQDVPDDVIVYGYSPNLIFKRNDRTVV